MEWKSCSEVTLEGKIDDQGHWKHFVSALKVWISRPHVLNKRIASCKEQTTHRVGKPCLNRLIKDRSLTEAKLTEHSIAAEGSDLSDDVITCCIRRVVSRPTKSGDVITTSELIAFDKARASCTFTPLECTARAGAEARAEAGGSDAETPCLSPWQYRLALAAGDGGEMRLCVEVPENRPVDVSAPVVGDSELMASALGKTLPHVPWLVKTLAPKVATWMAASVREGDGTTSPLCSSPGGQAVGSCGTSGYPRCLPIVDMQRYTELYQLLKEKYGRHLVKVWPERTDPYKFVYEDVAIASYLLVLWEEERERLGLAEKQSFIDLGCGNGLLVHLLAMEGHPGKGIDLRKRRIWSLYGPDTILEECAIEPSDASLFPHTDWIIGNHSDELTPWIPLIASRSAYTTRFFLLPCCFFDFHAKFVRRGHKRSQYLCYLDYIQHIAMQCGFTVKMDVMRIPSTKRVCLVGLSRSYQPEEENRVETQRLQLLADCPSTSSQITTDTATAATAPTATASATVTAAGAGIAGDPGACSTATSSQANASHSHSGTDKAVGASGDVGGTSSLTHSRHCSSAHSACSPASSASADSSGGGGGGGGGACSERHAAADDTAALPPLAGSPGQDLASTPSIPTSDPPTTDSTAATTGTTSGQLISSAAATTAGSACTDDQQISASPWLKDFSARSATEAVRNGTKLSRHVVHHIVMTVAMALLDCRDVTCGGDDGGGASDGSAVWNAGGSLTLGETADLFDKLFLRSLRQECGGLQTVLRNSTQVFLVVQGVVRLKDWRHYQKKSSGPSPSCNGHSNKPSSEHPDNEQQKPPRPQASHPGKPSRAELLKTKVCWFHGHHPQGCPLPAGQCAYAHGEDELRQGPSPKTPSLHLHTTTTPGIA